MTEPPTRRTSETTSGGEPRRTFGGRYELERELARGGMGTVYAARDTLLDRVVAIKALRPEPGHAVQDEFLREARAAAALKHPAIADVYDAGVEGDVPFIVMEYVPGETLRELMAREGPLPPARAAALAARVAAALEYAHRRGVVHCDIKPGNILLPTEHQPKIVDFGIARAEREPHDGALAGTAGYVAPEQIGGEPVDGRADVYGLGAVLYEMLTGGRPYHGRDLAEMAERAAVLPAPAHERNPAVPRALSEIVSRSLAPDRNARMPSAGALAAALGTFLDGQMIATARPEPSPAVSETAQLPVRLLRDPAARRPGPRSRLATWPVIAFVGLLGLLGVAGGALLALSLLDGGSTPVTVPQVTGSRIDTAAERLQALGLAVGTPVERVQSNEPLGTVIGQQPEPGARLNRSEPVHLTISTGP